MIYNPGGQLGKKVQEGGQRPAKQPGGPFLGEAAKSTKEENGKAERRRQQGGRGHKNQQAPQNQKR